MSLRVAAKSGAILLFLWLLVVLAAWRPASAFGPAAPDDPNKAIYLPHIALQQSAFAGRDRYVAPQGSDMGDCRASQAPCRSIGYAIAQAGDDNTIHVAAGVYTETLVIDKRLTLQGAGQAATIIDGGGAGNVLQIGARAVSAISRLTIRGGYTYKQVADSHEPGTADGQGGGIYNVGVLTVDSVLITQNKASGYSYREDAQSAVGRGGGIFNGGTLALNRVVVTQNASRAGMPHSVARYVRFGRGAGVFNEGMMTIRASAIDSNDSDDLGSGIYNAGTLHIFDTSISDNFLTPASFPYGGLYNGWGVGIYNTGTIRGDTIVLDGNESHACSGDVIQNRQGQITLSNSAIVRSPNPALVNKTGLITLTNSTIDPGIINENGDVTLISVTVDGISSNPGTSALQNTIVSGGIGGRIQSLGHNVIASIGHTPFDSNTIGDQYGDPLGTSPPNPGARQYPAPLDTGILPLNDQSGSTPVHELRVDSPAIDAGTCIDPDDQPTTRDQRGTPRPQGSGCDVGSYEKTAEDADLAVAATISEPVITSTLFTYTVSVGNIDAVTATASSLIAVMGSRPTYLSNSLDCPYYDYSHTMICELGDIASGQRITVTITARAPAMPTDLYFGAEVTTTAEDIDLSNNRVTLHSLVLNPEPGDRHVAPSGSDEGDCRDPLAPCHTIDYAIRQAHPGDVIRLAAGTYHASLIPDRSLSILGAGAAATIINGQSRRVLTIARGLTIEMEDLALRNGRISTSGAGVFNEGALWLRRVEVANNVADDRYYGEAFAGGVHNNGVLSMQEAVVHGNRANERVGGVYNTGIFTATNSTFSDNSGGLNAIENAGGVITLLNTTVAQSGSLVNNTMGSVSIRNTLITNNGGGGDISGEIGSLGYNLIGTVGRTAFNSNTIGDQYGDPHGVTTPNPGASESPAAIAARILPLEDNGGPTLTRALRFDSPALDAGSCNDNAGQPIAIDQRGMVRPQGSGCDIGAFEGSVAVVDVALSSAVPISVPAGSPFTLTLNVSNLLTGPAVGVVLTGTLPPQASFIAVSPECDYLDGLHAVICNIGGMASEAGADIAVVLVAPTWADELAGEAVVTTTGREVDLNNNDTEWRLDSFAVQEGDRYVSTSGSDDSDCRDPGAPCQTLRFTFQQTLSGDTINLGPGRFRGPLTIDRDLTLKGTGQMSTSIDTYGGGSTVKIQASAAVTVAELALGVGTVATGAALDNAGKLTLTRVSIRDNWIRRNSAGIRNTGILVATHCAVLNHRADQPSVSGAGIVNEGIARLTDCLFEGNRSTENGGAIINVGNMTLEHATIGGNSTVSRGGGIYNSGVLTITRTAITNNSSLSYNLNVRGFGAGIYNTGQLLLFRSTIAHNHSRDNGAGIFNQGGQITIDRSTISGNRITDHGSGAGIFNGSGGQIVLRNSTISGNSTPDLGAGLQNEGGSVVLDNVTVAHNTAFYGGGVSNPDPADAVTLRNSLLAANSGGDAPDFRGAVQSLGHNLISDLGNQFFDSNTAGDQYGDPLGMSPPNPGAIQHPALIDARLGPLAGYGGPTWIHALLLGSPAIDAGSCWDSSGQLVIRDQRSEIRPVGDGCDIGACEFAPTTIFLPLGRVYE